MTAKTTTTTLAPLTSTASKTEEISWLEQVATTLPAESYLLDLFSEAMLGWASRKIMEDVRPDIMGHLRATMEQQVRMEQHIGDLACQVKGLQQALDETSRDLEQVTQDEMAQRRLAYDLTFHNASLQDRLEHAQEQIQALKARIFDLEHPDLA